MNLMILNSSVEYEIDTKGCWNVQNRCFVTGYPYGYFNKKPMCVHRAFYIFNILKTTSLSKYIHVLHYCDNKKCINPEHLRLGTNQDNVDDKTKRGGYKNAKLSKEDVLLIRELSSTYTQTLLACIFCVDQSNISYIINNKSRKF